MLRGTLIPCPALSLTLAAFTSLQALSSPNPCWWLWLKPASLVAQSARRSSYCGAQKGWLRPPGGLPRFAVYPVGFPQKTHCPRKGGLKGQNLDVTLSAPKELYSEAP